MSSVFEQPVTLHRPRQAVPANPTARWSVDAIEALFNLPFPELMHQAQTVHRENFDPNRVEFATLLSVKTGGCPEDCNYCPQAARFDTGVEATKLMEPEEVRLAAQRAKDAGATRFCMGAAWRAPKDRDIEKVAELVRTVKALGLETCATLGMLEDGHAQTLQSAGLDYYNHNLDSAPDFYGDIITTRDYQDRLDTLQRVRSAGVKVCCGGIVGMGETRRQRAGLVAELANLTPYPESVPINNLVKVEGTPLAEALAHLNLLDAGQPSYAAMLLFGIQPQRFLLNAEVKCLHFHGTEVRKPIPSYQAYRGTVFELVDQAVDFVMSKITRSVGTRAEGPQAPVEYELPREVVAEAIVNAVAHRDYTSNASVQVMLFADRLEVWNPGELPSALTLAQLRVPHPSIPHNPLISEPLFLARYIERAGTGTLDMIARCREVGLPEPEFRQDGGQFVMTLWRDWLTAEVLAALGLNERERKAVDFILRARRMTNQQYQEATGASRATAKRDLEDLVAKGLVVLVGTGRTAHYLIAGKRPRNGSSGSPDGGSKNGS
jgi:biotin synthase